MSVGIDDILNYIAELSITNGGYGGDFETDETGQPIFVTDTASSDAATQQRFQRLLRMMSGADAFHPNTGANLPGHVGDNWTDALQDDISAKIINGSKTFNTISQYTPPTLEFTQSFSYVYVVITYTRVTGGTTTLPPLPLNNVGG